MNKKGFTLIELMATIGILTLMSLVIGANIVSILRSTEKSNDDALKEQLENAACVYVDSSLCSDKYNNCSTRSSIEISDLIDSGLIEETKTIKELTNKFIKVTRADGEKKCEYSLNG